MMDEIRNVLLVVMDSLRADTAREEMPFLQSLADDFVDVRSCFAPGSNTPSSMPGIMQSRLPIEFGGYGKPLPASPPTLAEALSRDDVRCAGWHSNVFTSRDYDFQRGFEVFADMERDQPLRPVKITNRGDPEDQRKPTRRTWRYWARRIADDLGVRDLAERGFKPFKRYGVVDANPRSRAVTLATAYQTWLDSTQSGDRRFAWLHLMDTHVPYTPPRAYRDAVDDAPLSHSRMYDLGQRLASKPAGLSPGDIRELKGLYRAEARYTDDQLRSLVDDLRDRNLWSETLLVATSDHGELFADRNLEYDRPLKHPNYLCEEISHVPLVIAGGGVESRTVDAPISGIDLAPTIADALSVPAPDEWLGRPLTGESRARVVSCSSHHRNDGLVVARESLHAAVRSDDHALLWWIADHDEEFFERTPDGERAIDRCGPEFDALLGELTPLADLEFDAVNKTSDEAVRDRLKDLGYIEN